MKHYVSVTMSMSPITGPLHFPGLPPEGLGCALVLHHPPWPPGPPGGNPCAMAGRGQAAPQGAPVYLPRGTVQGTQTMAPAAAVPPSVYQRILWGFLLQTGARNCHQ